MTRALKKQKLDMQLVCSDSQVMTSWITEKVKVGAQMDASISGMQTTRACMNV